jgi:hypothetical protein
MKGRIIKHRDHDSSFYYDLNNQGNPLIIQISVQTIISENYKELAI